MRERIIRFEAVSSTPYAQPGIICAPGYGFDCDKKLLYDMFTEAIIFPDSTLDSSIGERKKEGRVYRCYFKRGHIKKHKEFVRLLLQHKTVPMKVQRAWKGKLTVEDKEVPVLAEIYHENSYEVVVLLP